MDVTGYPKLCAATVTALSGLAVAPVIAGGPPPFTEEAVGRGVSYVTTEHLSTWGRGILFADLDQDGDPDILASGDPSNVLGVFENDGSGNFTDRSTGSGFGPMADVSGLCAGDYDRDGDLDVFVSRWDLPDALFRNDGGLQFVDVTAEAGVGDLDPATGCAWGDYDNDGWLDLYVSKYAVPNRLYRNVGTGTFEDMATELDVDAEGDPTFQASFIDFDRDGDSDIYLATDRGVAHCDSTPPYRNRLYENVGGSFVEITDLSGTEACADSMCIAIGDFDNNQYQDFYITNTTPGNKLLLNGGAGVFSEQAAAAGVAVFEVGWGGAFFDWDHDGWQDLYVCNMVTTNRFFTSADAWPCAEKSAELGVDTGGTSYGVATADVDLDGDVDMLVHNAGEPLRLYINHAGELNPWAKFDVIGEGPNRYAINAVIRVRTGLDWQLREVIAGNNYKSQNELVQHFGLDTATVMDEIEVMWPGGTMRSLYGYSANETWTLYPPDKLSDGDQDGDVDLDDYWLLYDCFTGPASGSVSPGCEMFDEDGDSDVDLDDYAQFLTRYEGTLDDCNGNGTPDLTEILTGAASDVNRNGVLDSCETLGDLTGDGVVNVLDLIQLLGGWGANPGAPEDLNADGTVNVLDLIVLLSNWG